MPEMLPMGRVFEIGEKTYNSSQINSVSTKNVSRYSPRDVALLWTFGGVVGAIGCAMLPEGIQQDYGVGIWVSATLVATGIAIYSLTLRKHMLIFDMSSGSVEAFYSLDKKDVELMREKVLGEITSGNSDQTE